MEKYIVNRQIGSGSFGKVFLVETKQTGIQYVLKRIDLSKTETKQARAASKEVQVLSRLKHRHIVGYKESYETENYLCIVMEYCENGDLHKKIKEKRVRNEPFADDVVLDYFVQICLALEYIHEQKILHRDLKTKNIFLTKGNILKLGDFGVAKVLENSFELASTCIGSPYYISPEICDNKPYNKKSDIWALGCVLYELSTLSYAFVAKNVKILIANITSGMFKPLPTTINSQIRSLLISLLKPNPEDRPTASEVLSKPFLKRFRSRYPNINSGLTVIRARSKSGNCAAKISTDKRSLSMSMTKLSEVDSKSNNITTPDAKYRKSKVSRTYSVSGARIGEFRFEKPGQEPATQRFCMTKKNWEISKMVKLLRVDSEYYNLIADIDGKNKNNAMKERCVDTLEQAQTQEERNGSVDEVIQHRRKWLANTLDKKELLTILGEAELIDVMSIAETPFHVDRNNVSFTVDDLLKLDPSEMSEDVLQPVKIEESFPVGDVASSVGYLSLLQREIEELKSKFEANDCNYDMEDLLRLTRESKRILKERIRKCLVDENATKNETNSVYFDLELKRMQLEKIVGLDLFLVTYRRMVNMLNGNDQAIVGDKEPVLSGSKTYVIKRDEATANKKSWMNIIDAFESKKEFIVDIWECAVLENLFY